MKVIAFFDRTKMDWIRDFSALNRLFFMAKMAPDYCPDVNRLWYLQRCNYSICASLILFTGKFATAKTIIDGSTPLIIFCHGTGSNVGSCYGFAQRLAMFTQCHVLLFDYPGYGLSLSNHHPNETSTCMSMRVILDHIIEIMQVPIRNIVLCGHSLGTAVATYGMQYCRMKYHQSIGGLILLNPFLSLRTAARDLTTFGCLILERFHTQDRMHSCDCPVLIIHGHQDEVIPVRQGISLYESISEDIPKESWFPLDANHDHCDLEEFHRKIRYYIETHVRPQIEVRFEYRNITPRIPPVIDTENGPSILTQSAATVAEITTGFINDSYRTCFFL